MFKYIIGLNKKQENYVVLFKSLEKVLTKELIKVLNLDNVTEVGCLDISKSGFVVPYGTSTSTDFNQLLSDKVFNIVKTRFENADVFALNLNPDPYGLRFKIESDKYRLKDLVSL